jgi:PhzF family phenazine biosynthesis protein
VAHPIYIIDAFASGAFSGNPAAVCVLDAPADETWMQNVAAEMKHAETAFVIPLDFGYGIRWFTPTVEVALCGHATLAAAHTLWSTNRHPEGDSIVFHTQVSGELICHKVDGLIQMNFPAKDVTRSELPPELSSALGVPVEWVGLNGMDYLVLTTDETTVRNAKPDHETLAKLPVRGVIITAKSNEYDFVSRFFAPGSGVPEDSVTGSAHCALGPFWAERLGKTTFRAFQASPRGGELGVHVLGDRVLLLGKGITVLRGELTI